MIDTSLQELTFADKLRLYPEIIFDETISANRSKLKQLLEQVIDPPDGVDKGKLLEDMAKLVLESPYLKFEFERKLCDLGENDLGFSVRKFEGTIFMDFASHLIVECKNWKNKPGLPEILVFKSKIDHSHAKVGIFFLLKEFLVTHG